MGGRLSRWPWLKEHGSLVFDLGIAAVLTVVLQLEVWFSEGPQETFYSRPFSSPILLLVTVPLVWRRRAPVAVAAAMGGGMALQAVVTGEFTAAFGILWALFISLYSVGAYADGRRRIAGLAIVVVAEAIRELQTLPENETDFWNGAVFQLLALAAFGVGVFVAARRRSRRLSQLADRLEWERDERERAALAEERGRMARELHDVVAHDVSAALLQAEAAEALLDTEPERARASLHTVQQTSREALAEMRRLVGMLRAEDDAAPLAPHPGLSELPSLVERNRDAGLPVELAIEGEPRELPPGIDFSAYRIVQESLTNVRKHAGSAQTRVCVRYAARSLEVDVVDDGRGGTTTSDDTGHGLIGMRERVAFFGGDFSAVAREQGGFVVRARFPLAAPKP
jgi:signal transduction histidine kinase